ncbi:hypothetical protein H8N03_04980 [Ramlibacter sp. USB13]|uniref:Uncharacterized protein n=1 Tax=Ramlibacter cellulosilyticus TaxID=2764187 RepID=A0A923MR39_9BURK|nr:hypothetical protein [Ramlibacter cellulosilyticus]MBC5782287.1 hypothetical protein [Ramlibacter cellulosilyticus]
MKKSILSAVAVAAFAVGGAAQADVIDSVGSTIARIFGVPYDASPAGAAPIVNVYTDAYGRHYQVDAAGRHLPLDQYGSYRDQWGRTVYLDANRQPAYIAQNGQLIPYGSGNYAMAPSYDRDGDGVTNQYDRAPNDARYR